MEVLIFTFTMGFVAGIIVTGIGFVLHDKLDEDRKE